MNVRLYNLRIYDSKGYLGSATFDDLRYCLDCAQEWLSKGYNLTLTSRTRKVKGWNTQH